MPDQLNPQSSSLCDAASAVPPPDVAYYLLSVFMQYCQTNYFYIDERSFRSKLRGFYSFPTNVTASDAPWLATILLVCAVGTQFAHLGASSELNDAQTGESHAEDDKTALAWYHAARRLIPEIMAVATTESVQAFVLLGVFTRMTLSIRFDFTLTPIEVPLDAAGVACTYLGIAIRIATQMNMHRQCPRNREPQQAELCRKIWWTAYTLERFVPHRSVPEVDLIYK